MKRTMRALSIRQPYAEEILRGRKKVENRSINTKIRERVYIYASLTPDTPSAADLPRGVLVGTMEIVDSSGANGRFRWQLRAPRRLTRPMRPRKKAQPVWFRPF